LSVLVGRLSHGETRRRGIADDLKDDANLIGNETDVHVCPESLVAQIAACELLRWPVGNTSPATQHVDAFVQLTESYSSIDDALLQAPGHEVQVVPPSLVSMTSLVLLGIVLPTTTVRSTATSSDTSTEASKRVRGGAQLVCTSPSVSASPHEHIRCLAIVHDRVKDGRKSDAVRGCRAREVITCAFDQPGEPSKALDQAARWTSKTHHRHRAHDDRTLHAALLSPLSMGS